MACDVIVSHVYRCTQRTIHPLSRKAAARLTDNSGRSKIKVSPRRCYPAAHWILGASIANGGGGHKKRKKEHTCASLSSLHLASTSSHQHLSILQTPPPDLHHHQALLK
ncbi:hypothetical protein E2C01_030240 [Portunus trituberculatus]|uniref:Uncharacterized protein n=1 Tax=Portunus trituberculatus TaxID=210409 RepID=A0A5B7EQC9_PORTR|nr:hypothetical protein [Portunus trituberculatus]